MVFLGIMVRTIMVLRSKLLKCVILGGFVDSLLKSSVKGQSREMSARNTLLEFIFGFWMRFSITDLKTSGGNEHPCWKRGVQLPPEVSSRVGGEPGVAGPGVNPILM